MVGVLESNVTFIGRSLTRGLIHSYFIRSFLVDQNARFFWSWKMIWNENTDIRPMWGVQVWNFSNWIVKNWSIRGWKYYTNIIINSRPFSATFLVSTFSAVAFELGQAHYLIFRITRNTDAHFRSQYMATFARGCTLTFIPWKWRHRIFFASTAFYYKCAHARNMDNATFPNYGFSQGFLGQVCEHGGSIVPLFIIKCCYIWLPIL